MKILKQVSLDSVTRKKDKSVGLRFTTDLEQSSQELADMDEGMGSRGVLYYKAHGELTQQEVDELDTVDIELEGKTKSQRLRAVMYILWKQQGEQGDFKEFYSQKMEKIISQIKDRLEDE